MIMLFELGEALWSGVGLENQGGTKLGSGGGRELPQSTPVDIEHFGIGRYVAEGVPEG
jgi:hypothetical protein